MASVTSTPTSLIAANKRDYLPDKQLHARQLPKDARRNNFGTGVIYTAQALCRLPPCAGNQACVWELPPLYTYDSARGNCVCADGTMIGSINDGVPRS